MFEINKVYTFSTVASTLLGSSHKSLKAILTTSAKEAIKYLDIYTLNEQVLGIIGNVLPNVNDMVFIVFENTSGDKVVLSRDWIITDTIEEVSSTDIKVTVRNIKNIDVQTIGSVLRELGYVNLDIEILTNDI